MKQTAIQEDDWFKWSVCFCCKLIKLLLNQSHLRHGIRAAVCIVNPIELYEDLADPSRILLVIKIPT